MSVPSSIATLLHRGKALAAEVHCQRPDWRAWVWVQPVMKNGKTLAQAQEEWTRTRSATLYDDTIDFYRIRYVELSQWHLSDEWFWDLDIAIKERPIVDENRIAESEAALEEILSVWLPELSQLTTPGSVDYPDPPSSDS
ncbi:hypothetical protein EON80_01015 [bacterium]|nr:MAG: hypothetical protein EON80_01015 [bacterium]